MFLFGKAKSNMKFVGVLDELVKSSGKDVLKRKNGTLLIYPGEIPKSRHMLFRGLSKSMLKEGLIDNYVHPFPEQYKELLLHYNGANLCTVKVNSSKGVTFAMSLLTIYGLPATPPFGRAWDMEEPFDVRIEDLSRHKNVSMLWLKFASYEEPPTFKWVDCFVDTESGKVYACPKDECDIVGEWDSIDECLCSLFEKMSVQPLEHEYQSKR